MTSERAKFAPSRQHKQTNQTRRRSPHNVAIGFRSRVRAGSGNYARIYQPHIGGTTRKLNTVVSGNLSVTCSNRLNFWNYSTGGNPKRVMPADPR